MTVSRSLQTRVLRSTRAGRGFTLVELLVVIAIIALILGIALPALQRAKDQARIVSMQATQRVLATGLEQFNNDLQGYPSSTPTDKMTKDGPLSPDQDYGAQLMVQALIGWDGLGYVDPNNPGTTNPQDWYNLDPATNNPYIERFGPYIQADSVDLKTKTELQVGTVDRVTDGAYGTASDNRVVVDIFRFQMPMLYYRANASGSAVADDANSSPPGVSTPYPTIYDFDDNDAFTISTLAPTPTGAEHFDRTVIFNPQTGLTNLASNYEAFQNYLWDPQTFDQENPPALGDQWFDSNINQYARPFNKDTFVLISAGPDGMYGSRDDVRNFIR